VNIDQAIHAIRDKWAVPVKSIPDLRSILEQINPDEEPKCGAITWPYTENNICVLKPHKGGRHKDAREREFD
jgi:hypothetical protein